MVSRPPRPASARSALIVHVSGGAVARVHRADGRSVDYRIEDADAEPMKEGTFIREADPCPAPACRALAKELVRRAA